jgi:hypothetical protein
MTAVPVEITLDGRRVSKIYVKILRLTQAGNRDEKRGKTTTQDRIELPARGGARLPGGVCRSGPVRDAEWLSDDGDELLATAVSW